MTEAAPPVDLRASKIAGGPAVTDTALPSPVIPEISGTAFEQTMVELGYPAWWRDDRVTRAIDAAWRECREAGSYTPRAIAAAAKNHNLPPLPIDKWASK